MARSLLLVASGFALALIVVVVAVLVAVRALTGPSEPTRGAHVAQTSPTPSAEDAQPDPDEAHGPATPPGKADVAVSGDARLTMNNVALVAAPGVTIDVVRMKGALRSAPGAESSGIDLEKPDSFEVIVDDAEVRVREAILQKLAWSVDREVPGLAGARVVLDKVVVAKGRVVQEGTFSLGPLHLPFHITGTLAATKNGDVRVEVIDARVAGLDTGPLVDALNLNMRELLKRGARGPPKGVKGGEGLSLVVSPAAMATKPRMIGKIRSVRIDDDVVVVELGDAPRPAAEPVKTHATHAKSDVHSLVIAGGHLILGKMQMTGAVAELVDTDDDPLMIDMKNFQRQLFASVCRATPQGVRIHMVDANDVRRPEAVGR